MNEIDRQPDNEVVRGEIAEILQLVDQKGGKHYELILSKLRAANPNDIEKQLITTRLFSFLQSHIENGHFKEIEKAGDVLGFLGVKEFFLNAGSVKKISELYKKYPLRFLYNMTPSLFTDEKMANGLVYDRVKYVRDMMIKEGDTNPSDEEIADLWRYREILITLHTKLWNPELKRAEIVRLLTGAE